MNPIPSGPVRPAIAQRADARTGERHAPPRGTSRGLKSPRKRACFPWGLLVIGRGYRTSGRKRGLYLLLSLNNDNLDAVMAGLRGALEYLIGDAATLNRKASIAEAAASAAASAAEAALSEE